jgi:predicted nucleic acid-binding protein
MIVCRDLEIMEVLTADADFDHEGFRILPRDE